MPIRAQAASASSLRPRSFGRGIVPPISGRIQLDGRDAPVLSVVEFRNLPTGLYQITGVLVGEHGPRASVLKLAKVAPSVGR